MSPSVQSMVVKLKADVEAFQIVLNDMIEALDPKPVQPRSAAFCEHVEAIQKANDHDRSSYRFHKRSGRWLTLDQFKQLRRQFEEDRLYPPVRFVSDYEREVFLARWNRRR